MCVCVVPHGQSKWQDLESGNIAWSTISIHSVQFIASNSIQQIHIFALYYQFNIEFETFPWFRRVQDKWFITNILMFRYWCFLVCDGMKTRVKSSFFAFSTWVLVVAQPFSRNRVARRGSCVVWWVCSVRQTRIRIVDSIIFIASRMHVWSTNTRH